MADANQKEGKSMLPVIGLVVGVFALISSWVPIANNVAFFVGIVGLVIAVVGLVKARKLHTGKGLAAVAIVVNVLALVIVLATQALYGAVIDEATSGVSVSSSQEQGEPAEGGTSDDSGTAGEPDYGKMKVGKSVTLDNGVTVCVKSVKTGLVNYDGSKITQVTVSYKNGSEDRVSFNEYDWKAESKNGSQRDYAYYDKEKDSLDYGKLKKGGSVSGNLYFEGTPARIVYAPTWWGKDQEIAWVLK